MLKNTVGAMIIVAALTSGCASNPARASSVVPLNVPEPPPREPVSPVPVAGAPVPVTAAPPPEATPTAPIGRTPQAAPAASAPAAASPPPPSQTTPAVAATPPPELRPAGPGALTPTPARVVESLARVKRKLDSMDRQKLSDGKRADYDSAQRFLTQAADAVKGNNLLLAQSLAEKAEMLADGLR